MKEIVEASSVVVEGLKQYVDFVSKHGLSKHSSGQFNVPKAADVLSHIVRNELPKPQRMPGNFPPRTLESESRKITPEILNQNKTTTHEPASHSKPTSSFFQTEQERQFKLSEHAKERKVPANRASRFLSFTGLAFGLGVGAVEEFTKRAVSWNVNGNKSDSILGSSLFLSEANARKIVDTLCQVRGAALKLGQMLSIQDNEMIGPELQRVFERVRQSADYMPYSQMTKVLCQELGQDWRDRFQVFDEKPFAAASIGQVHRAELWDGTVVAVKIQYPGVAESIESDIKNVLAILKYANVFPEGLFIDHIMAYAKKELSWEVDYVREANCGQKYTEHVEACNLDQQYRFIIPTVYQELSTGKVLTTKMITGVPVDKLANLENQSIRNSVSERLLRLFLYELFVFNYMQTDPNWSNFFYDLETDTISLIDFGSSRPFEKEFVAKYMDIMQAAIDNDRKAVLDRSLDIGFLSGYETEVFKTAHVDSVMILGEGIRHQGPYDFGHQSVTKKIHKLVPLMLQHRLKPPPEEIYSLHRKLSGLFLLFTKLGAKIDCRSIFEDVTRNLKSDKIVSKI